MRSHPCDHPPCSPRTRVNHAGAAGALRAYRLGRDDDGRSAMSDKPTYLGLLNGIALAETAAGHYLTAWADCTPSTDVRGVLRTVAAREREHGAAFAKRISELGYEVREKTDPS